MTTALGGSPHVSLARLVTHPRSDRAQRHAAGLTVEVRGEVELVQTFADVGRPVGWARASSSLAVVIHHRRAEASRPNLGPGDNSRLIGVVTDMLDSYRIPGIGRQNSQRRNRAGRWAVGV